jgi:hypothetical protein
MRTAACQATPAQHSSEQASYPKKRTDHREQPAGQIDENQNNCPRQPNSPDNKNENLHRM